MERLAGMEESSLQEIRVIVVAVGHNTQPFSVTGAVIL